MYRTLLALGCLAALSAAGCCMCAAPYDYCAPTYTGQCGEDCRPHARVGSAFSYGGPMVYEPTLADGPVEIQDGGELPAPESVPPRKAPTPPPSETYSALRSGTAR